jgi:hypothetical protein
MTWELVAQICILMFVATICFALAVSIIRPEAKPGSKTERIEL